jgi:hypothetical protein
LVLVCVHGIEDIAHKRVESVCQKTWLGHRLNHRRRFAATWLGRNRAPRHGSNSQAPALPASASSGTASSCLQAQWAGCRRADWASQGEERDKRTKSKVAGALEVADGLPARREHFSGGERSGQKQSAVEMLAPEPAPQEAPGRGPHAQCDVSSYRVERLRAGGDAEEEEQRVPSHQTRCACLAVGINSKTKIEIPLQRDSCGRARSWRTRTMPMPSTKRAEGRGEELRPSWKSCGCSCTWRCVCVSLLSFPLAFLALCSLTLLLFCGGLPPGRASGNRAARAA